MAGFRLAPLYQGPRVPSPESRSLQHNASIFGIVCGTGLAGAAKRVGGMLVTITHLAPGLSALGMPFSFPQGAVANEQILLRWMHFFFGIIWIGLLYFFNLVGTPTMKGLEPAVRARVFPALMSQAMWWFRWSALVTVISGLRYFWMLLAADARNAGNPALAWQWMSLWLAV